MLNYVIWNVSPEIIKIGSFAIRYYGLRARRPSSARSQRMGSSEYPFREAGGFHRRLVGSFGELPGWFSGCDRSLSLCLAVTVSAFARELTLSGASRGPAVPVRANIADAIAYSFDFGRVVMRGNGCNILARFPSVSKNDTYCPTPGISIGSPRTLPPASATVFIER